MSISSASGKRVRNEINFIALEFNHSLRIPNHHITVEIIDRKNEVAVDIHSEPMNADQKWEHTKKDTTVFISKDQFKILRSKTKKLKEIDVGKACRIGTDGTSCAIKIGGFGNSITYKFWSPDYSTSKRGLENFVQLVKDILQLAGFDPKEIL